MTAETVIAQGRAFTEALMASRCRIERATGEQVLDEQTGNYVPAVETVYEGACKVKFVSSVVGDVDAQSQFLTNQTAVLSLPVEGSDGVVIDDVAVITLNPMDDDLVGKRLRIAGYHGQTFATARRFQAELTS